MVGRYRRAFARPLRAPRGRVAIQNSARVKECEQFQISDGVVVYARDIALANAPYDRAQQVARAYQEFRINYIKFTWKPHSDTYQPIVGNQIPQLYYIIDKVNALPAGIDTNTFLSMGCKPLRFDDKNLSVAYKPCALGATQNGVAIVDATHKLTSPWLSTNDNAGNPTLPWAANATQHHGLIFFVTKINATDDIKYSLDIEVDFEFRKPNWKAPAATEPVVQLRDLAVVEV